MGLFDGLGSYDTPERRSAVKRQQAALLQQQIAEKQHLKGRGRSVDDHALESRIPAVPPPLPGVLPEPNWPWQAGAIPPYQAWRSPGAAAKPMNFPMFPAQQLVWPQQPQPIRSYSDSRGRSYAGNYAGDSMVGGDIGRRANLGPGVGRGIARPISSSRGGWLPPQMRSQADEIIYGHDLDGYAAELRGPRASPRMEQQQPPPRQQYEPPQVRKVSSQRPQDSSEAQKAIDAEWEEFERMHPQLARRRRRNTGDSNDNQQENAPEVKHSVAKKKNVVDIDAEWAEWESKHPEFQKRKKRKEGKENGAQSTGTASVGGASNAEDSPREVLTSRRMESPVSSPSGISVVVRPPPLPAQVPTPVPGDRPSDRQNFTSQRREEFRYAATTSLQDELRRLRNSCADQRSLLHLEVEKLKAQASRALAEQSQLPSSLSPLPSPLRGLTGAPRLQAAPLRHIGLDRQRLSSLPLAKLVQETPPSLSAWPAQALIGKFGNHIGSGLPPELAIAELRLGPIKAEPRQPDILQPAAAVPGYPQLPHFGNSPTLESIDPALRQQESGATLPEASTLVFLDAESQSQLNPQILVQQPAVSLPSSSRAPGAESQSQLPAQTSLQQPAVSLPGTSRASDAESQSPSPRIFAQQPAVSLPSSSRAPPAESHSQGPAQISVQQPAVSLLSSNRAPATNSGPEILPSRSLAPTSIKGDPSKPRSPIDPSKPRSPSDPSKLTRNDALNKASDGESEKELASVTLGRAGSKDPSKEDLSKDTAFLPAPSKEEALDMDSLRYSATFSVDLNDTNLPSEVGTGNKLEQAAFSKVMDLGAALRGESMQREHSPSPTDEGNNETMILPKAEIVEATLLREVTPPPESIPGGVGELGGKAPPLPGLPMPSPRSSPSWSPNVSPRRILPRPKSEDAERSEAKHAQEETEGSAARRTQDFLMDVLIPETQGQGQSSAAKSCELVD